MPWDWHGSPTFMLVDTFTVLQNIVLGMETVSGAVAMEEAREKLMPSARNMALHPDALVSDITVGMGNGWKFLRCYRNNDILIFDEPTAVLTPRRLKNLCTPCAGWLPREIYHLLPTNSMKLRKQPTAAPSAPGEIIGVVDVASATKESLFRDDGGAKGRFGN